jgi:putative transposase
MTTFIDEQRARWGVEPICRTLQLAPSSYYAAKTRPPSPRSVCDAALLAEIDRIYSDPDLGRDVYGPRKVWRQLHRARVQPARAGTTPSNKPSPLSSPNHRHATPSGPSADSAAPETRSNTTTSPP